MFIRIKHISFYLLYALYYGLLLNLFYYALLKSSEISSVPWFVIYCIGATLVLDFLVQIKIKGSIPTFNIFSLLGRLNPPDSKGKDKNLYRIVIVIAIIQYFSVKEKIDLENFFSSDSLLSIYYLLVVFYFGCRIIIASNKLVSEELERF